MDQMENIGTLRNKQIFHYSRNNGAHDGEHYFCLMNTTKDLQFHVYLPEQKSVIRLTERKIGPALIYISLIKTQFHPHFSL